MKLKNLQIENYRSIENLSIDFHQQLNVFVGANGAGKSTILDAVATSLSHLIRRIENPNRTGLQISYEDIRNETDACLLRCGVEENEKEFYWQVNKVNKGRKSIYKSDYSELNQLVDYFQKELKEKKQLPVVCSYPISREVEKINPKVDNNGVGDIFKTYENALDGRRDYKRFFEWYRNQEDIVNQEMSSQDYLYKINQSWMLEDMFEIVGVTKKILQIKGKEVQIINEIIKGKSGYIKAKNPRWIFLDLKSLLSHSFLTLEANSGGVLRSLENIFHALEVLNRQFRTGSVKMYHELFEHFIIEAITEIVDTSREDNIILINYEWKLLSLTLNLAFWQCEMEVRDKVKDLTKKMKDDSKYIVALLPEIIDLFHSGKKIQVKNEEKDFLELQTIRQTVESFLPDYTNMRVDRKGKPQMLIDKNGQTFSMEQLSDGEKNLIALVGDIARRFAIAYPNSEDPLKENGIILIDEVDLHLHPAWQRLVIPKLVETFPNCQFFISTHSPQVISHVKHWSLFLLKNEDNKLHLESATESFGKTSDRILVDLLGVSERPEEIKDSVSETYNLIEENNLSEAQQKVEELEKLLPGDPEWSKMNVLIKRRKILGK